MRIVHEITTPMQVACGSKPYSNAVGTIGYNGIQVELTICTDCAANHPDLPPQMFGEEWDQEIIEIEGNGEYILAALKQAVSLIELLQQTARERMGEKRPAASCA
jgi:hypothetical protein